MKKQILISLVLISSIFSLNAQLTAPVRFSLASFNWEHQISSGDGSYYLFDVTGNNYAFMIHRPTGNVGIGTINPNGKLDVHLGAVGGDVLIIQKNSGPEITFKGTSDVVLGSIGIVDANQEIRFYNGAGGIITQKMVINSSGDVGIGNPSPAYKLDVCGTIRAKEVKVDLQGGCDFVFKSNYKLMDLKKLEEFVKTNQHLPEIAPEKEMVENGVNMKELQMKLLQKIEELTIYTIEQNKKNEQQNAKIKTLEEKIEKLESASR